MFAKSISRIDEILEDAKTSKLVIDSERIILYNKTIEYIKEHNLTISNHLLYIGKKDIKSTIVVYGYNIFRHANNLANILSEVTIYITLYTNRKNEDFLINIYRRPYIQFYNIYDKIYANLFPIEMDGLNVYPPELELINVYNKLYLPEYSDEWDSLLQTEKKLFGMIKSRHKLITGGKSTSNPLLQILKARDDYVLIGPAVIDIFKHKYNSGKLYAITSTELTVISNELCKSLYKKTGKKHIFKISNVGFPTLPRLQRSNIILDSKIIAVIYNSATYELVPYTVYDDTNIAHVSVICMYMLLDAWHIRELYSTAHIDKKIMESVLLYVFKSVTTIRALPIENFTQEIYLGTYSNIVKYRMTQKNNIYPPYIPEKYRYNNGAYRTI